MQRLTQPDTTGGYTLQNGDDKASLQRLGMYEDFHSQLLERQAQLAAQLEQQRAAGKKSSARFRETLGQKMVESSILLMMEMTGL